MFSKTPLDKVTIYRGDKCWTIVGYPQQWHPKHNNITKQNLNSPNKPKQSPQTLSPYGTKIPKQMFLTHPLSKTLKVVLNNLSNLPN